MFEEPFNIEGSARGVQPLVVSHAAAQISQTMSAGGHQPSNYNHDLGEYIENTLAEEFSNYRSTTHLWHHTSTPVWQEQNRAARGGEERGSLSR